MEGNLNEPNTVLARIEKTLKDVTQQFHILNTQMKTKLLELQENKDDAAYYQEKYNLLCSDLEVINWRKTKGNVILESEKQFASISQKKIADKEIMITDAPEKLDLVKIAELTVEKNELEKQINVCSKEMEEINNEIESVKEKCRVTELNSNM